MRSIDIETALICAHPQTAGTVQSMLDRIKIPVNHCATEIIEVSALQSLLERFYRSPTLFIMVPGNDYVHDDVHLLIHMTTDSRAGANMIILWVAKPELNRSFAGTVAHLAERGIRVAHVRLDAPETTWRQTIFDLGIVFPMDAPLATVY